MASDWSSRWSRPRCSASPSWPWSPACRRSPSRAGTPKTGPSARPSRARRPRRISAAPYQANGDYSAYYEALPSGFSRAITVTWWDGTSAWSGTQNANGLQKVALTISQGGRVRDHRLPEGLEIDPGIALAQTLRRLHADERGTTLTEVLVGTIIGAMVMGVVATSIFTTNDLRKRADDRSQFAGDISIASLSFDRDGAMATAGAPAKSQTSSVPCSTAIDLGFQEGGASVRYRPWPAARPVRCGSSGSAEPRRGPWSETCRAARGRRSRSARAGTRSS